MTGRLIGVVLLSCAPLAVLVAQGAQQATPPRAYSAAETGTGQIGGVVTSADGSDQPIRRAIVRIFAPELRGSREIATDDRGRFLFTDLPAGRFQLSSTKPGYVIGTYGQKRPRGAGTPISLAAGQKEVSLRLQLPKGAVVSGRVTDEFGQPIARARLAIAERTTVNGQTTLTNANANNVMTDDRGEYRLYGLPAGTYVVSVSSAQIAGSGLRPTTPADLQWAARQTSTGGAGGAYSSAPPANQMVAFAPVFHPSAIDAADAASIELKAGEERSGVDIAIRFVPVASVAGTVTMPDGQPASGASVLLVRDSPGGAQVMGVDGLPARTTPRGEFTLTSVKAGEYKAMVQASSRAVGGRGGGLDLWGMTSVSVDGRDVSGVTIALQPGMTFSGRVVVDSAATTPAPDLATTRVSLEPAQRAGAAFGVPPATIAADGAFAMAGAAPGSYRMRVSPPLSGNIPGVVPVWAVKSVVVQGRNVLDRSFEIRPGESIDGAVITLTDRITALSGKLVDGQGKPALDYFVVVLPFDPALWVQGTYSGPRSARPANDGAFRFNALPPGEYYIAAATDVDTRALADAAFLQHLIPGAIKVTIAEGEKKVQDLKIGG